MKLSPDARYWLGWTMLGLVGMVVEFWVIVWAIRKALHP